MAEPDMPKPLETEVEAETGIIKAEIIEGIEIELFSENEANLDSKALRDILKKHQKDEGKSTENTVVDLGDSKMIILKTENVEGVSNAPDNEKQRMTTKVAKDGETIYCVENHLKENIYTFPEMEKHHDHAAHNHADRDNTVKIIMDQAEKISMPELRDRAYLDLVSYALDNHDTASANIALSKIEQVELRDTARNRIAVNYAKNGNAEKAFAILGEIEVDELRDVMRLQVIEALIATEAPHPHGQ